MSWIKKSGRHFFCNDDVDIVIYKPKYQQCFVLEVNKKIVLRDLDHTKLKQAANDMYNL